MDQLLGIGRIIMSKIKEAFKCPSCHGVMDETQSIHVLVCCKEYCICHLEEVHKEYVKGYWYGREQAEEECAMDNAGEDL